MSQLGKNTVSLTTQITKTKSLTADAENRDRAALLSKFKALRTEIENLRVALLSEFKTLRTEIENLRMKLENEAQKKHDAMRLLSKDQADIQLWKS